MATGHETPPTMMTAADLAGALQPPPAMLTTFDLACALQLSERQIRRLQRQGKIPKPTKIGNAVRWRRETIDRWMDADCPDRETWEAMNTPIKRR